MASADRLCQGSNGFFPVPLPRLGLSNKCLSVSGIHHTRVFSDIRNSQKHLAAFVDGVDRWISERLRVDGGSNANLPRLARLAEVWEKIARAARDTQDYNLERKPLVFSVFSMLAEATR